jgi:hypothetical protein
MSSSLSERDLRALVAVVEDGRRDEPGPAMPWAALDSLNALIPCDELGIVELALPQRMRLVEQFVHDDQPRELSQGHYDPKPDRLYWELYDGFIAPIDPDHTGQIHGVVRFSDVYSRKEMLKQPLYMEIWYPEVKHCMVLGLPSLPGHTRNVILRRFHGRDFTDRDKLVMELLRPHLFELYQDAQKGHGNADIARLLFTSLSTVRKHMEHIFDHTGVRTRGAAVARMLPHLPR